MMFGWSRKKGGWSKKGYELRINTNVRITNYEFYEYADSQMRALNSYNTQKTCRKSSPYKSTQAVLHFVQKAERSNSPIHQSANLPMKYSTAYRLHGVAID